VVVFLCVVCGGGGGGRGAGGKNLAKLQLS
jgi:hypothetical protein